MISQAHYNAALCSSWSLTTPDSSSFVMSEALNPYSTSTCRLCCPAIGDALTRKLSPGVRDKRGAGRGSQRSFSASFFSRKRLMHQTSQLTYAIWFITTRPPVSIVRMMHQFRYL